MKGKFRMPNIIDYFYQDKHSHGLSFSLCLSHIEGGFLSFGNRSFDKHIHGAKTYKLPISRESGQYNVNVYGMRVKHYYIKHQLIF